MTLSNLPHYSDHTIGELPGRAWRRCR